jgi:hypothetical protein
MLLLAEPTTTCCVNFATGPVRAGKNRAGRRRRHHRPPLLQRGEDLHLARSLQLVQLVKDFGNRFAADDYAVSSISEVFFFFPEASVSGKANHPSKAIDVQLVKCRHAGGRVFVWIAKSARKWCKLVLPKYRRTIVSPRKNGAGCTFPSAETTSHYRPCSLLLIFFLVNVRVYNRV